MTATESSADVQTCPDHLIELACRLADAAGPIVRSYFRTELSIDTKADDSPVTIADREVEAAMRAIIEEAEPTHGIFGEEYGKVRTDADYVWVLDPIDGTQAFMTGLPVFGTLIALAHRGTPVLGIIDQAISRERWIGAAGHPTRLNGNIVRTSGCSDLSEAAFFCTTTELFATEAEMAAYTRLRASVRLGRFGGDCYAYGLLSAGFLDIVAEASMNPYDYMALAPVVQGAGGVMSNWKGDPISLESGTQVLAAASPALHAATLSVLQG